MTSSAALSPGRVRLTKNRSAKKWLGINASVISWIAALIAISAVALVGYRFLAGGKATYWVVTQDVPINANLAELELKPTTLNLGSSAAIYFSAAVAPIGYTARAFSAGELLTANSIQETPSSQNSRVVVQSKTALSAKLKTGSVVEVWAAQKIGGEYAPVEKLVHEAQVAGLIKASSPFESGSPSVELQLSQLEMPAVLDAIAAESAIYLVPIA